MAHQADDLERRRKELGETPASHPGVELQVHANVRRNLVRRDDELEARISRLSDLAVAAGGSHDDDPRLRELPAELEGLGHGRDAECGSAGAERGAGNVDGAVAVAVRLHDGPELGAGERAQERVRVAAKRSRDRSSAPTASGGFERARGEARRSDRLRRARSVGAPRPTRAAARPSRSAAAS